jgi:hypothetical protein
MKKQVIFFIVSFLPLFLCAQTTVPGGNVNGTWAVSGSPYEVIGDITVPNGDTLIIEPGVQVVFQDEFSFTIAGRLEAIGTETDSIRFTVQDTTGYSSGSYTGWNGLRPYYAADSSNLKYCIVEFSKSYGIYCEESILELHNCIVRYNYTGVYVVAGSNSEINNSKIERNRGDGIYINYYSSLVATNVSTNFNSNDGTSIIGDCDAVLNNFNSLYNEGTGMVINLSSLSYNEGSVSNNQDGGFLIDNSASSVLQDLTIANNNKGGNGGGIFCDYGSSIIGTNLLIQYNIAENGGGIYIAHQSDIFLDSTTVYYNHANTSSGSGGGINIDRSTVNMTNSSINMCVSSDGGGVYMAGIEHEPSYFTGNNLEVNNNTATLSGAGFYCLNNTHVDLDSTTIYSNHANLVSGNGGGLYMKSGNLVLSNISVTSGRAYNGAGMYVDSTEYQITGGVFSSNMADNNGGGIFQRKGIAVISDVQFNSNKGNDLYPGSTGGGIYNIEGDLTLSNLSFANNRASASAGGIWSSGSTLDLDSVDFSGCYVINEGFGGGMVIQNSPDCNLTDVNFLNCYCDYQGGGLYCSGSTISLLNVKFDGNESDYCMNLGGGMYCSFSTVSANNVEFTGNYHRGLYCVSSSFSMLNSEVSSNYYGGIYIESANLGLEKTLVNNNYFNYDDYPTVQLVQSSQLGIINSTFVNNQGISIISDATSTVDALNSIVWGNASPAIGGSGVFTATYSDIQDSLYPGTGNISLDPLFVDTLNNDYNLGWVNFPVDDATKSPCIDTGDSFSPKDPDSSRADMGAYFFDQYYEIDLKVFLEGPFFFSQMIPYLNISQQIPLGQPYNISPWNYDGIENVQEIPNGDIVDWLLIEYRNADSAQNATGLAAFGQQAVFLKTDGSIVGLDGINYPRFNPLLTNDLYVVVKHRNHLGIISSAPPVLNGRTYSYDFTNGENKVLGGNKGHKELNFGIWGMLSADGNADGQIDNKDKNDIWFLQQSLSGYLQGDFDMNSEVEYDDKSMWEDNAGKSGFVPE